MLKNGEIKANRSPGKGKKNLIDVSIPTDISLKYISLKILRFGNR